MTTHLETWLADLLENRADKRWTPTLHARAETITRLGVPTVKEIAVQADENVPEDTLEVRGEAYDEAGNVIGEEAKAIMTA
jgi:hypothetical protein